ncbi:MAG TPA: KH domain-containing protein [Gaiellaceae bacterium]
MSELLAYLARELVDDPEAVRVEEEEREDALVLVLHVAPDDVGKVIGRQGRIARALRTLVRASSARDGRRVVVEIADPEE